MPTRAVMLKHTQPFNLTGHPAITLPAPSDGLPLGLQLVGRRGGTAGLLAIAAACEDILRT
jgi:Asp-tRNA(Asn)/Glu-tRNA(Gln) amidotransferase A subunit family amidase